MANLYITEYAGLAPIPVGQTGQIPLEPALAEQKVAFTTHAESAAFNAGTRVVRLHTDGICSVLFSAAGTAATTASARMAASQTEYYGVPFGQGYIVSVVSNS